MKKSTSAWSTNKAPIFVSSYQGSADYILADGRKVSVRTFANPTAAYNTGVYLSEIEPLVGTVRFANHPQFHDMPGSDVLAWFPGFIGARFRDDWTVEYDGTRPQLVLDPACEYVYSALQLTAADETFAAVILERSEAIAPGSLMRWNVSIWKDGERQPEHVADFFGRTAQAQAQKYHDGDYVTRKLSEGYRTTLGPVFVQS